MPEFKLMSWSAVIDGKPTVLIVSDDASREEGRPGRYLLLAQEQIRIFP